MEKICKKTAYASKEEADQDLIRIRAKALSKGQTRKVPTRSYPCSLCSCWHLTSAEKRTNSYIEYRDNHGKPLPLLISIENQLAFERNKNRILLKKVDEQKETIDKQSREITKLRVQKAKNKAFNVEIQKQLANKYKAVRELQGKLADKTRLITSLTNQLNTKKNG